MGLEKKPFVNYNLDEKPEFPKVIPLKMNEEEYNQLRENMYFLQQVKESTAIKQLNEIASKVLLDEKIKAVNKIVMNNYRKNKRLGIIDFD